MRIKKECNSKHITKKAFIIRAVEHELHFRSNICYTTEEAKQKILGAVCKIDSHINGIRSLPPTVNITIHTEELMKARETLCSLL